MAQKGSPASRSEDLLLENRARAGDATAAARLLEEYRVRLVNLCRGYLGRIEDAEDAAQDVITKMLSLLPGRWPQGPFRASLYCVARNHCLNLRRRRGRSPVDSGTFASAEHLSPRTGPHTAVARRERDDQLQRAMASLATPLAEVLFLRYFEDLSRAEIARILELSESAVKARLAKARRELAIRMERHRQEESR